MEAMVIRAFKFLIPAVLLVSWLSIYRVDRSMRNSGFSQSVTLNSIRQIEPGMTEVRVIEILGEPFDKKYTDCVRKYQGLSDSCDRYVLHFTRKVEWFRYPMLWVQFEADVVASVYAKLYEGPDDMGIYLRDESIDWEHERFAEVFPERS